MGAADGDRHAEGRARGLAHAQRGFVEEFEAHRLERRIHDTRSERLGRLDRREGRQPRLLGLGHGLEAKRELAQDAERAQRADHQLGHVVAGHRLDDARSAPGHDTVGLDEAYAEHEIAQRPVTRAQWPRGVGRDHPAERSSAPSRRIHRQPLTPAGETFGEAAGRDAGLQAHGEIVGVVLEDVIEARQIEDDVDA